MPFLSWRLGLLLLALLLSACQAPHGGAKGSAAVSASAAQVPPAQRSPGPYRITVLDGGKEVELLGEISKDSIAALMQVLAANPQARVLQLTSPGGNAGAVRKIWTTLVARKLTTVVPLFCASACAELFLAGDRRFLADGAVLGFHQHSIRYTHGLDSSTVGQAVAVFNTELADRMVERGVGRAFAQRVIATPPDTLWYPSRHELLAAGVLTGGGAPSFHPPSTGKELATLLDWSLFASSLESAYRDAFPEDYAALRAAAWKAIRSEGFESEEPATLMAAALTTAVPEALSVASNAAAAAYIRGYAAGLAYRAKTAPQDCYKLIEGEGLAQQAGAASADEERLEAYYHLVVTELLEAIGREPRQTPPTKAEYEAAYRRVIETIRQRGDFDAGDARAIQAPKQNSAQYCALGVRLINAVLQMPQPDQGTVLRGMLIYDSD